MLTLRDILVEQSINGQPIMDMVEKKTGIAMTMGIIPSSNGTYHKYKISGSLATPTIRQVGGSVTPSSINNTLGRQDLQQFTILQAEDAKTVAEIGGGMDQNAANSYFKGTYPQMLESMLQALSKQIIYGTNSTFGDEDGFKGFHDHAKANSKRTQMSGTPGGNTSIFVVRWNPNFCSALVDPNIIKGAKNLMYSTQPIRESQDTNVSTYAQIPSWKSWHLTDLGLMVASTVSVWAITQVDASHIPTSAQLMAAMRGVHSDRDIVNTKIYCNERGRDFIFGLNDANLQSTSETDKYDNRIMTFNGVEIVVDENISDVETAVLD